MASSSSVDVSIIDEEAILAGRVEVPLHQLYGTFRWCKWAGLTRRPAWDAALRMLLLAGALATTLAAPPREVFYEAWTVVLPTSAAAVLYLRTLPSVDAPDSKLLGVSHHHALPERYHRRYVRASRTVRGVTLMTVLFCVASLTFRLVTREGALATWARVVVILAEGLCFGAYYLLLVASVALTSYMLEQIRIEVKFLDKELKSGLYGSHERFIAHHRVVTKRVAAYDRYMWPIGILYGFSSAARIAQTTAALVLWGSWSTFIPLLANVAIVLAIATQAAMVNGESEALAPRIMRDQLWSDADRSAVRKYLAINPVEVRLAGIRPTLGMVARAVLLMVNVGGPVLYSFLKDSWEDVKDDFAARYGV